MSPYMSDEIAARRREYEALRPSVDVEEAWKKAAKARQEAIVQQMKAQQASFAINFDDLDDEDDEGMSVDEGNTDEAEANVLFGTCIVCQEELLTTGRVFGALGLVQPRSGSIPIASIIHTSMRCLGWGTAWIGHR